MSFEKPCTPSQASFWSSRSGESKESKCSIQEKAIIDHTYRALEIVADSFGKNVSAQFPKLFKECVYLRALYGWESIKLLSEEEIETIRAEIEKEKELEDDPDEFNSEDFIPTGPDPRVLRFVEIMKTSSEMITEEMKEEAFSLFPEVICSIGNVGDSVNCDDTELIL